MCGIVAYNGKPAHLMDTLLSGLKRLEYRGYDSAGLAVIASNRIYSKKAVGRVQALEDELAKNHLEDLQGVGLAHTRWATHGMPTQKNAHPHSSTDKKIWLVHNGIIENYQKLKLMLQKTGHKFYSDTDTEVVAKLVGHNYHGDLRAAVLKTASALTGAFSLCVISKDEPQRLIGVKFASPLVVGVGKGEYIVASDASAIVERTKNVIYLEDGELVDINGSSYEIVNFKNKQQKAKITKLDWDVVAANKQGYDHFLLKEIMEQPNVIKDSVRGRLNMENAQIKFGGLIDVEKNLAKITKIHIIGVGTSYYAAKLGELYFNELTSIPAVAGMSPEFRYTKNNIDQNTWVIAMSQSGETADTIAAVEEAKRHGALVTGIVNVVGSTMARITQAGVYNHIGPEVSVASTKAFTSQCLILLMHAIMLGRSNGLSYSEAQRILSSIKSLPNQIEKLLRDHKQIQSVANKLTKFPNSLYIGRQYNYPIALEGALKLKEISYIHAEGLSGGELKHGFIALIDHDMPTVAIATNDSVFEKTLANIAEIKARKGKVFAVANAVLGEADQTILVPKSQSEYVQPLINNVALQLLAYYVAKARKLDIDKPRNLAKSVTVE